MKFFIIYFILGTDMSDKILETIKPGDFGYNVVSKHNDLIRAYCDLNVTEYKLLLGCISKINSFDKLTSETPVVFSLEEAGEVFDFDYKNSGIVKIFRDAANELMTKIVRNEDSNGFNDTTIAQQAIYDRRAKTMTIYFSRGIIPYVSGLRRNLTTYRILHIGKMTSKYAIRLYELLIMWLKKDYEHKKVKELEIEELKKLLAIKGNYDTSITMFKKTVIEPAFKQINELTDIHLEVKFTKTEKKITHIELTFSYKDEWIKYESELRENKKLTKDQIRKIINNKEFYDKYFNGWLRENRDKDVGVLDWMKEVEGQLKENAYAYYPEYSKYLN